MKIIDEPRAMMRSIDATCETGWSSAKCGHRASGDKKFHARSSTVNILDSRLTPDFDENACKILKSRSRAIFTRVSFVKRSPSWGV